MNVPQSKTFLSIFVSFFFFFAPLRDSLHPDLKLFEGLRRPRRFFLVPSFLRHALELSSSFDQLPPFPPSGVVILFFQNLFGTVIYDFLHTYHSSGSKRSHRSAQLLVPSETLTRFFSFPSPLSRTVSALKEVEVHLADFYKIRSVSGSYVELLPIASQFPSFVRELANEPERGAWNCRLLVWSG